ncbi:hypothetical protein BT63DRAFT_483811 [Microthyrium microscopicum]|uniref:Uncharacterized protein n=1 Tax=Microthyrium microscopicum TaxID=703497 RepID=A0A6A6TXP2_9PEZI|nr:hypothetical protein BT63DRAFT_483811 [Microthyrium microscopicum]
MPSRYVTRDRKFAGGVSCRVSEILYDTEINYENPTSTDLMRMIEADLNPSTPDYKEGMSSEEYHAWLGLPNLETYLTTFEDGYDDSQYYQFPPDRWSPALGMSLNPDPIGASPLDPASVLRMETSVVDPGLTQNIPHSASDLQAGQGSPVTAKRPYVEDKDLSRKTNKRARNRPKKQTRQQQRQPHSKQTRKQPRPHLTSQSRYSRRVQTPETYPSQAETPISHLSAQEQGSSSPVAYYNTQSYSPTLRSLDPTLPNPDLTNLAQPIQLPFKQGSSAPASIANTPKKKRAPARPQPGVALEQPDATTIESLDELPMIDLGNGFIGLLGCPYPECGPWGNARFYQASKDRLGFLRGPRAFAAHLQAVHEEMPTLPKKDRANWNWLKHRCVYEEFPETELDNVKASLKAKIIVSDIAEESQKKREAGRGNPKKKKKGAKKGVEKSEADELIEYEVPFQQATFYDESAQLSALDESSLRRERRMMVGEEVYDQRDFFRGSRLGVRTGKVKWLEYMSRKYNQAEDGKIH